MKTLEEIGKGSHSSTATVSRVLRGLQVPDWKTLASIIEYLFALSASMGAHDSFPRWTCWYTLWGAAWKEIDRNPDDVPPPEKEFPVINFRGTPTAGEPCDSVANFVMWVMNPDREDPPGEQFMESQPVKSSFVESRHLRPQRLKKSRIVHRFSQVVLIVLGSVAWATGLLNVWQALVALVAAMLVTLWVAVIAAICIGVGQEINTRTSKGPGEEDDTEN
ncbi:hypothetical protein ACFZDB_13950 [Streptomyces luteogriseus]|uniref:hypothetical protein n=1 Tax=Streptomyces luteogriseus TaxID=68233 RepID=UPI0036E06B8A